MLPRQLKLRWYWFHLAMQVASPECHVLHAMQYVQYSSCYVLYTIHCIQCNVYHIPYSTSSGAPHDALEDKHLLLPVRVGHVPLCANIVHSI